MRYIRWAQKDEKCVHQGSCRAKMKKSVTYNVDILLDKMGNCRQSQCERAAGMSKNAHCKHTLCLLYSLVQFATSGNLNTELSCTDRLVQYVHLIQLN